MEKNTPELKITFGSPSAAANQPEKDSAKKQTLLSPEDTSSTFNEVQFTEKEQKLIDDFSEKIDITNSGLVLGYGAAAQKKVSDFSDAALEGIRTKDFGETGEMISNLVAQLKGINDEADKGGFLGLFKRTKNKIENMKIKYAKAEESVNGITEELEKHQIVLLKDIAAFDNLYDMNLEYLKELTMYIAAGKKKLEHERSAALKELLQNAQNSGLPQDAQKANDYSEMCNRFERKIHDLELTRMVAIQMAPQIRLLQNNDTMMSEKIQTVLINAIPLWKNQMVLALGIAHSAQAIEAQRSVTDMTNELLKKNAQSLHQATVDIAKESERGIVDIETLTTTNEQLIATLDEVYQIQSEAKDKRRTAEAQLNKIEKDLKNKLLEINIK